MNFVLFIEWSVSTRWVLLGEQVRRCRVFIALELDQRLTGLFFRETHTDQRFDVTVIRDERHLSILAKTVIGDFGLRPGFKKPHRPNAPNQSINRAFNQSLNQSSIQSINQSIKHSINQSIYHSINQSITQSINRAFNQSLTQSITQSINQSSIQSITHSINHSINLSVKAINFNDIHSIFDLSWFIFFFLSYMIEGFFERILQEFGKDLMI